MAWKNLTQTSLADDLIHQHQAITELDDLNELIDWKSIERLMKNLHNKTDHSCGINSKIRRFTKLAGNQVNRAKVSNTMHKQIFNLIGIVIF